MLKFFVILILISIVLAKTHHYDALLKMAQEATENCYEDDDRTIKIEITEEGFTALDNATRDPPRNTRCLRFCIMQKQNLYNREEKRLNTDEMLAFFEHLYHNRVEERLLMDIIEKCSEVAAKETDRCEMAHIIGVCIINDLNEKGIDNL